MQIATASDSFVALSNLSKSLLFLLNNSALILKHLFHLCNCLFEGAKSRDIFLISLYRESKLLDKFLISIFKVSEFLVDFCEIKIVFNAINTNDTVEVIMQYLIIFCPLLGEIKRGVYFSNLDQMSPESLIEVQIINPYFKEIYQRIFI